MQEQRRETKVNPQMGREGSTAIVKAAPPGDGHPKTKVPIHPNWGFYEGLVTRLSKTI